MGAYEYLALTGRGREQRGVLEGDSARHVRQQLRERGLSTLEVNPVSGRTSESRAPTHRDRVPIAELVVATRQLATLARAGLPVGEVLGTVAEQSSRPATRRGNSRGLSYRRAAGLLSFSNYRTGARYRARRSGINRWIEGR